MSYKLIRHVDDKIYGEPETYETIEQALDAIMERIAHSSHCDVGQLAPIAYQIDLVNKRIIVRDYVIQPTDDHEEIEHHEVRYHTYGHHL